MPITSFPPAPSRADPATFADRADAYLGHLENPFVAQANALEANVNAKEVSANTAATNASASASAASATANVTAWNGSTVYSIGTNVWDTTNFLTYRRRTTGAGATRPGLDPTNWALISGQGDATLAGGQTFTSFNTFTQRLFVETLTVGRGGGSVDSNTALGAAVMTFNSSGTQNTGVGYLSLSDNTQGSSNTAVGSNALDNNTIGNSNTAVGMGSLTANVTATGNTGIGVSAGNGVNTNWNTALGAFSLRYRAGANGENTAIGAYAMEGVVFNSTGFRNTAVGTYSLRANTSGNLNTAVGFNAMLANQSGDSNTAVGGNALLVNVGGNFNTAVGQQALNSCTTGGTNSAVGSLCLSSLTTFDNCSGLGASAQVTASNQVQLGSSGTTTYVYGTVQNRSDIRDKADVKDTELGLDFINALRPVDYKWDMREDYAPSRPTDVPHDADEETKAKYRADIVDWLEACKHENIVRDGSKKRSRYHHGLIAQEVKAAVDELGVDFGGFQDHKLAGGHDVLSIGYDELIAPLIKAVQELTAQNKDLCARIQALETT